MLQSILTSLVDTPKVDMIMVGSTIRTKEVRRALKDNGILTELIETPNVPPLPGMELRAGSGAVAIVGMSGRFPGSDDVTQFWESLLAGKDFHKKVRLFLRATEYKVTDSDITGSRGSVRPLSMESRFW
jgi:hypothetical protein